MSLSFKMPTSTITSNLPGQPFNVTSIQRFNVLLLGSGGRESALAWKIARSPLLDKLFIAPGNGGTDEYGQNVNLDVKNFDEVSRFVDANGINLIIVGPEYPLVNGIADHFLGKIPVLGPVKAGARLEGSKDYAKEFMSRHNIPTARYKSFTLDTLKEGEQFLDSLAAPYVLKADGLAAGKGVLILQDLEEAKKALREMLEGKFGQASSTVLIEEFLDGIECSVFVLTDGTGEYRILPVAKDYKRIYEGDKGPNTGGMGAVSPVPFATEEFMHKVEERIIKPTINGLKDEGIDYRGFIFLGLINVKGDPMVIEYNVRMGDPETEAVMPRIDSDLLEVGYAAACGKLKEKNLHISPLACATVMAVSDGYPGSYQKGKEIEINLPEDAESIIFHAGTKKEGEKLKTSGGRVLSVSSLAPDLEKALDKSYQALKNISFDGMKFRTDIGNEFISR